jgi:hypothetical protein
MLPPQMKGWMVSLRWPRLDSQILRVRAARLVGSEHGITWRICRNVTANLFDDP